LLSQAALVELAASSTAKALLASSQILQTLPAGHIGLSIGAIYG
jgi:hypothetical protein